jgi:uncharacterized protein YbjT (DUF2867 family)
MSTPEHDPTAAIAALLAWQSSTAQDASPPPEAPAFDAATLSQFFETWGALAPAVQWGERERGWADRARAALLAQAALPPRIRLRDQPARSGPVSHDLAALLRPPQAAWDEAQELDWAVRYWEGARRAGLLDELLAADFGEFWHRVEWSGLLQHLALLNLGGLAPTDQGRVLAQVVKVASRYIELSGLKRLLEAVRPELFDAGFNLR